MPCVWKFLASLPWASSRRPCGSGDNQRAARSDLGGGGGALAGADFGPIEASGSVRQAQGELKREGLYRGKADGVVGPETTQGIAAFQERGALQQSARLDRATRDRLNIRALRMDRWSRETAQSSVPNGGER
jgi:peptidoglycan hydrolase-like protein with peptidoglycan-binding domain